MEGRPFYLHPIFLSFSVSSCQGIGRHTALPNVFNIIASPLPTPPPPPLYLSHQPWRPALAPGEDGGVDGVTPGTLTHLCFEERSKKRTSVYILSLVDTQSASMTLSTGFQ